MIWVLLVACTPRLDRAALLDPETCVACHPTHHEQWSGSMHAYAAEDPVFRAMNALGQQETAGALGDFCVRCHAPMAVSEGLTTDGLDLDDVPAGMRGVTCAACHLASAVDADHNNGLVIDDEVLRGAIEDPLERGRPHLASWSPLHDRNRLDSSRMCGSCHDVVTPAGVPLERTYAEWSGSLYAENVPGRRQTCGSCHMPGTDGLAAEVDGVGVRRVHRHTFAAVDTALTPFPQVEAQAAEVQELLDTTVVANVCVAATDTGADVTVVLDNVAAGHRFPSGAAQDRRVWVEVVATSADTTLLELGTVGPDEAVPDDPDLWRLGDRIFDAQGAEVHMFWQAASYTSDTLPVPATLDPQDPEWFDPHVRRTWHVDAMPDRVRMRVRLRPIGLPILDELVTAGLLDADVVPPEYVLNPTAIEWTPASGPCEPPLPP